MESPIDQRIWKWMFHGIAGFLTVRCALSLLNERRRTFATLDEPFTELRKANTVDEQILVLQRIMSEAQDHVRQKKGGARLSMYAHARDLTRLLKLHSDGSNAASVEMVIGLVDRVFGADAEGRKKLHEANGHRLLLSVLSEAHRQGHRRLMQAASQALHSVTEVDEAELVLAHDVPYGAEGAYHLTQYPSTVKMLRLLDASHPIVFLHALTGIFANLTALRSGAEAIGKGTDGTPGIRFFLSLLDHGNQGVVEHCAQAIRHLTRASIGHEELCTESAVVRLAAVFDVNRDPKITNAVLTILLIMVDGDHRRSFLSLVEAKTDILPTLFQVWCRGTDKMLRDRAEFLVHLLDRTELAVSVRRLMEQNRTNILERKAKDEEAKRKQMQQLKQQQMMQQMMMSEMGGGGMDPMLAAMMGGGEM